MIKKKTQITRNTKYPTLNVLALNNFSILSTEYHLAVGNCARCRSICAHRRCRAQNLFIPAFSWLNQLSIGILGIFPGAIARARLRH